ncbi:MAG: hypothetical protein HY905_24005 [Deltaproteobacteria bacterium]|nr:hypothetical protein [Deltaproteobacteria bacterium]
MSSTRSGIVTARGHARGWVAVACALLGGGCYSAWTSGSQDVPPGDDALSSADGDGLDAPHGDDFEVQDEDDSDDAGAGEGDGATDDPYVLVGDPDVFRRCEVDRWNRPCTGGMICCSDAVPGGTCVNPAISSRNCGGCGRICPYPMRCRAGRCVDPPPGMIWCSCAWADPTSIFHCGSCGNLCPAGSVCAAGTCSAVDPECDPPDSRCGSACYGGWPLANMCAPAHCCDCMVATSSVPELGFSTAGDDPRTAAWAACAPFDPLYNPAPGECNRALGGGSMDRLGYRDVACEPDVGLYPLCVAWFGGERLHECPPGFVEAYRCLPLGPDDSSGDGWLYSAETMVPCGTPETWFFCGGSGSACRAGECTCMPPYQLCPAGPDSPDSPGVDVRCIDLSADPENCGHCGVRCFDPMLCTDGVCAGT